MDLQRTTVVVIQRPAALLTLAEAKAQVRRDDGDDDLYLTSLIAVVQGAMEGARSDLGRSIMPQTLELRLSADAFRWASRDRRSAHATEWCDAESVGHPRPVHLPYPPFVSLTSVSYRDHAGIVQTLTGCRVFGDPENAPMLMPPEGQAWPEVSREPEAIRVRYVAGYADASEGGALTPSPPPGLKHAALLMLAHLYENRMAVSSAGNPVALPLGFESLVGRYRVHA